MTEITAHLEMFRRACQANHINARVVFRPDNQFSVRLIDSEANAAEWVIDFDSMPSFCSAVLAEVAAHQPSLAQHIPSVSDIQNKMYLLGFDGKTDIRAEYNPHAK